MAKIANKNCRSYVEKRKEFSGSNMWGEWRGSSFISPWGGQYVVYSYGHHFPIYIYDDGTGQWFGNQDKFSQSTTRQQSLARPHDVDITWLSTKDMSALAVMGYTELAKRRLGVSP